MSKEELKPIDVSKYTVTESGNVIKSEEKETTKEDFFRQNFSEYCRGDTFLSPYWDLFEIGYDLKQGILSQHILDLQADKGNLTDRVTELEKENADLKCECRRCVHTDSPCILSDYGKDRNGICDHFKDVFDEVVELKKKKEEIEIMTNFCKACKKMHTDNLTKAKGIIKGLLSSCFGYNSKTVNYEVKAKAESFLKECK